MTSEIENVTKDGTSFERKADADKAILVSSANLIAGPDGIVPLSNQSAMILPTSIPAADGEEKDSCNRRHT